MGSALVSAAENTPAARPLSRVAAQMLRAPTRLVGLAACAAALLLGLGALAPPAPALPAPSLPRASRSRPAATREALEALVLASGSADLVAAYSRKMEGETFHHHFHVLYDLRTLLGRARADYAEIGSHNGGSLILAFGHPLDTNVVSIDPLEVFATQAGLLAANVRRFNTAPRNFTQHRRRSTDPEFLAQLEAEGFACDILFVDGDHSYAQVRADWDAYRGFVRPGGFLVFDDYGMADSIDVKRAVDGVVLSLAQEARERALVGAEASWSVWGQLANSARARPPEMALNNEFILHRVR
jgi:predicted O-methyltransferase YrrM